MTALQKSFLAAEASDSQMLRARSLDHSSSSSSSSSSSLEAHRASSHSHGHSHNHAHSLANCSAGNPPDEMDFDLRVIDGERKEDNKAHQHQQQHQHQLSVHDMILADEDDVELSASKRRRMITCGYVFMVVYVALLVAVHSVGYFFFIQFLENWSLVPFAYVSQAVASFCYMKAAWTDPGFLPPSSSAVAFDAQTRSSSLPPSTREIENAAKFGLRFCSTCQIIRPLRAKHCKFCNRCVARFDHHCPFVSNCVGAKNNPFFSAMIVFQSITLTIGAIIVIQIMVEGIKEPKFYFGIPRGLVFSAICLVMMVLWVVAFGFVGFSAYRIMYNITTNEQANHMRYNYIFFDPYFNRFDKGAVNNCSSFWSFADDKPIRNKL